MDKDQVDQLWTQLRVLLRAPSPPDNAELRRAARLLMASRGDAVELLLARLLALSPTPAAEASGAAPAGAAPPRHGGFGVREAVRVSGGLATGLLLGGVVGGVLGSGLGDDGA
jgi:hypothetical protein